jgi:hypothetical protein
LVLVVVGAKRTVSTTAALLPTMDHYTLYWSWKQKLATSRTM